MTNAALAAERFGILLERETREDSVGTKVPTLAEFAERYLDEDTGNLAATTVQTRRQQATAKSLSLRSLALPRRECSMGSGSMQASHSASIMGVPELAHGGRGRAGGPEPEAP